MSPAAVELRNLTKDFVIGVRGVRQRAVDGLSFRIEPGEVFGLLGPNGSGKSTTIKLLLGLLSPTAGTSEVFGRPSGTMEARQEIGYLPEAPQFPRYVSGRELVTFYARICGLDGALVDDRVERVLAQVSLAAAADRRVATYSKGMLQRLGLAQALVHDPRLVILDEPTAGVDPVGSAEIASLILQLKRAGKTVLITSHLLAQVETICDRVAILDRGRLLVEGVVAELFARDEKSLVVSSLPTEHLEELRSWLAARGSALREAAPARGALEQLFLQRVGQRRDEIEP